MVIIQFNDVWEMYKVKFVAAGKVFWESFWALKGINFSIDQGETVGIIGENGAGKSTILKLIAGMLKPDKGIIKVSGRFFGLLELGAGFQPELTGRENIYLNASLFGLTDNQIDQRYEKIVGFANIGKFIDVSTRCYSQGMLVRLAFAIAIHIDSDILLIDDTLAVGDEYFQNRCIKKIFELKDLGKTIILVSHDMNMLSRICKRTIFLKDGKVIKDNPTDKVIALYAHTFGIKEGSAILENKPLVIVFNNGRFILSWKDKILNSNTGIYGVFLIANRWFNTLQAEWEIKKEKEDSLVATGKFYQLSLTLIWKLEINVDYTVKWSIEIDSKDSLEIQEGCINIMLVNDYVNWFSDIEKGKFSVIEEENKIWQAVLKDKIYYKCVAVAADESCADKVPSLIFEQFSIPDLNQTQLFNTDYYVNSRALQYKQSRLQNYSAVQNGAFLYFSGKIIFDSKDIESYIEKTDNKFVISQGKIKLIFDKGTVALCYDGINLTKTDHMTTAIFINGNWVYSNSARWDVAKENGNKLIVKCEWQDFPIIQIWEIEIKDDCSFLWKVKMEVKEKVEVEEQHVLFMCAQDYKHWVCDYGEGFFPEDFIEIQTDVLQRCVLDGTIGLTSGSNQFPKISLRFSKELKNFAGIFNSDFYYRSRVLRVQRIEPEADTYFAPGEYNCFAVEVKLDEKISQIHGGNIPGISGKNKLKFVFDKGRGSIYFNGVKITKRLGFYTSLRSEGVWHDSVSSAIWKVDGGGNNTMRFIGKWRHLPICQHWEVILKDENTFEFNIRMIVEKEIEVERLQTNLMLLERYSLWAADIANGAFPVFKEDVDSDWSCVWRGSESAKYIGVLQSNSGKDENILPSLIFSPKILKPDYFLKILNSDIYHRARVLQYLNNKRTRVSPGESRYFTGSLIFKS